ncbi:hypothetical protein TNCT_654711 [Trichonephila clavata]|uniref:Uncharacterized protein n=1 Tax=Trichonephila clavata TaxID=2740835 RepID=A0A8X6L5C5_TRICU|nr:hypothetical protein TNCT_654711 [Trichonephila clavata]
MWLQQNHQLGFFMITFIFGCVLRGSRTHATFTHDPEVHHVSVQISGDRLRCLWELDFNGIRDTQIKTKTGRGKEIKAEFCKTYQTEESVEFCFCVGNLQPQHCPQSWLMQKNKQKKHCDPFQKRFTFNDVLKKKYEGGC